ncbi:MAG TPA: hypothetical protein VJ385_10505 [Fibrobacteria bacterium]|nr:hypothetical protein [Fibrobacteria bacterium]
MKEVDNAMAWFPWKGVVRFLYWVFQEFISLPQAVRDMEEGPDFVPSKRYLENEFKKYARLHNAALAAKNSEPLTPALQRVLEEAIHVTGTHMDSIRERQQVREKELEWLDLVPEYMHMEDVFPDAPQDDSFLDTPVSPGECERDTAPFRIRFATQAGKTGPRPTRSRGPGSAIASHGRRIPL